MKKCILLLAALIGSCGESQSQEVTTNATTAKTKPKPQPVWFAKWDANRNGVLDPSERQALQAHAEKQRTAFILSMDKNGDGKIDSREQWLAKSNRLAASSTAISTNIVK